MMKKFFVFIFLLSSLAISAQTQVANGDFETWTYDDVNLPNNWNSFQTASGQYASMGYSKSNRQVRQSAEVRPGSEGQNSVVIWARSVVGVVAQGNLTSGRVNAGSMSATAIENYNWSDRNGSTTVGEVTNPCAMKFTGRPDSVVVWTKFVPAGMLADAPYAKFSAIVHGDYDYISYGLASNDTEENKAQVVASVERNIESLDGGWQRISMPFVYTQNNVTPAYIIVNFSTNAYPGKGTKNDSLYIDDIQMIYNSEITSLLFNHKKVTLDENNHAVVKGEYDESKLSYKINSQSASVELNYNDEQKTLSIVVKGADIEENPNNQHTYTVVFEKEEVGENPYVTVEYPEDELSEALPVDPSFFASYENPYDFSQSIVNADMELGQEGWTISSAKSKFTSGGADEDKNGEFYNDSYSNGLWGFGADDTSFDINQTITNLPNGIYKVTVQAFNRPGDVADMNGSEETGVVLYANNESKPVHHLFADASNEILYIADEANAWMTDYQYGEQYVPNSQTGASAYFEAGHYVNSLEVVVTDGTLKLGLRKPKDKIAKQWTCFDNFTLTYYGLTGESVEPVEPQLEVEWPEKLEAAVVRDLTTEPITVNFNYAEGVPAEGWRYAYLELVQGETTVLMGYCDLEREEKTIEAQVPNMLQTGDCKLVLRIGNGETKAETTFSLTTYEQAYTITFVVDGETLMQEDLPYGAEVVAPEVDPREGYTFAWTDEVPEIMPAHDVTINGAYTVNTYKVTYLRADGETTFQTVDVDFGQPMPTAPTYELNEAEEAQNLEFVEWEGETYETMPAKDVTYTAKLQEKQGEGISVVEAMQNTLIYNLQGQRVQSVRRGQVYIINGKKYIVK